jgi:hypothetical protein
MLLLPATSIVLFMLLVQLLVWLLVVYDHCPHCWLWDAATAAAAGVAGGYLWSLPPLLVMGCCHIGLLILLLLQAACSCTGGTNRDTLQAAQLGASSGWLVLLLAAEEILPNLL